MAKVGAKRAAELTGTSKSTIQRAMDKGKLSFEIDANNRRLIDVSELERVFGVKSQTKETARSTTTEPASADHVAMELELEKARHALEVERLKMEVRIAQEQLETAQQQITDLKVQRDLWQKQAQQILLTSQYSQKQSEERITELREREEARQRAVDMKRAQSPAINNAPRVVPAPLEKQVAAATSPARNVQPAENPQSPVFRTVQAGNQNRLAQPADSAQEQKTSLFASLFGSKKTKKA
jgi:hypothetical protein